MQPSLRHRLPGAWRLLRTWPINENPNRAPPIPEQVVHAMAGWAFLNGYDSFGVSPILGFYAVLRSGELLGLRSSHILCSAKEKQVLISLGHTNRGKRRGAAESVALGIEQGVLPTRHWKKVASSSFPVATSPGRWRALFSETLKALGLSEFHFRPCLLRRGGATWWFEKRHSLDRILVQGRWLANKTARIYINEGLAMMAQTRINFNDSKIRSFL